MVTKPAGEAFASRGGTAGLMIDLRRLVVLAAVSLLALSPGMAAASPAKSKRLPRSRDGFHGVQVDSRDSGVPGSPEDSSRLQLTEVLYKHSLYLR